MRLNFTTASTDTPPAHATTWDHNQFEEEPVRIGLVLTGGGSHGAFEAGVLEAILPELIRIGEIVSITGTSAGAVNAVAAGSGLNASGPDEAINRLHQVWDEVQANGGVFSRGLRFFADAFLPQQQKWPNLPSLPFNPVSMFQSFMPSYAAQFISRTVKKIVKNWAEEVQDGDVKININTIIEKRDQLGTFEHRNLSGKNLTPDGVGSSANLKNLGVHHICDSDNPELTGRRTYDGAYHENGSFTPHLDHNVTDYIMVILHDRRHNELDAVGALKHAEIHSHALDIAASDSSSPARLHAIEIESMGGEIGGLAHMDNSSKLNTDQEFIGLLYQSGLEAGRKWLKQNKNHIGHMSSYSFYQPALKQLAEVHYS